ncbi:hypothetical protein CC86DRAFT_405339 [Ophiobolus disseminans]|uniref:F-box domain-containing protein n=1 Tax=Ophiobolus disseminans TaxID=1469910 RepID=A0A6A7A3B0_9PLEO|nr:hypothetical protein CC86DRAFT_405339 [Ophiobolus disseminans]
MVLLLDLPPELFQLVVNFVLEELSAAEASKYRLTCKPFANVIDDDLVARQGLSKVFKGSDDMMTRFFTAHGGAILRTRFAVRANSH